MDYTYKNSLFHRISEFHYFSELLDNKMDNMLEHPWIELQVLIKEKWLTQKAFSSILWKKVSEVNELLKWKRNITIQRDYLLHQTLWTPIKYWILKQIDYDYSLLDIEETPHNDVILSDNEESTTTNTSFWTEWRILGDSEQNTQDSSSQAHQNDTLSSSWASAKDLKWKTEELNTQDSSSSLHSSPEWQTKPQETPVKKLDSKDDEDLKNRAKIFRTF